MAMYSKHVQYICNQLILDSLYHSLIFKWDPKETVMSSTQQGCYLQRQTLSQHHTRVHEGVVNDSKFCPRLCSTIISIRIVLLIFESYFEFCLHGRVYHNILLVISSTTKITFNILLHLFASKIQFLDHLMHSMINLGFISVYQQYYTHIYIFGYVHVLKSMYMDMISFISRQYYCTVH